MIDIDVLRNYYASNLVYVTEHANMRFRQRGIKAKDVRTGVMNGEIIEQYPDDYPFPSCLILGKTDNGNPIHIVMSDEGSTSRIITAYIPDKDKWDESFKIRRD